MYKYELKEKQGHLKVTIPAKEWEEAVNRAYEKTKGRYKVQGFREGKAPRRVIEQTYGDTVFFDEAFEDAISAEWAKFLNERQDVNPASRPAVDMESFTVDKGIVANLTFDLVPEVELGSLTGLKTKLKKPTVSEEAVQAELDRLVNSHARFVEKEGKAELGDIAIIDFSGAVDGVKFEGGTAENYRLELGSHTFIEGFEEQVEGMTVGETKDINVKFPEAYHAENLKGKPAVFTVTLNKLEKKELPELSDKFIADSTECETLDEYKKATKEKLLKDGEQRANYEYENALIDEVVSRAKVEVPHSMIHEEAHYMIHNLEHRLSHQGMTLETYLAYTGSNMDELHDRMEADAERTIKTRLTLQKIVTDNNIKVEEADMDAKLAEMAGRYNMDLEELKKTVTPEDLSYFENEVLMTKILAFIKGQN